MMRIGIDVGGTFTDFTILDPATGAARFHKVPSTPDDPSEAIEAGLADILSWDGFAPDAVGWLGHGTTVATNIVVERRGARAGLLTTKGFRDVLELGRQARPSIYDYRVEKPAVLIPRDRRFEVTERIGPAGEVLEPLEETSLSAAVAGLAEKRVEAVAIVFLHAWRLPDHEAIAKAAVLRALPGVHVSVSSELLPEFREYERTSTTVVNAFVGPRMGAYLDRFRTRVADLGISAEPYVIHSAGGLMSVERAREAPVRTCLSGPAAGVVGAAALGRAIGLPDLVTFDVGGTSTDVSVIVGGAPSETAARTVAGHPVKTAMLDIHVIGAGGGSIAAIDDAGALKVGPRSAGAVPGPAAYGLGGTAATITDANLVLGRLDPSVRLAGRLGLDAGAAQRAVETAVAGPLGLDVATAAHGILVIANAAMSRAIRSVSVGRGHDLSAFTLAAFGGAGPLHCAEVAAECGIPRILVPEEPGTLCARGMLLADLALDLVRSRFVAADADGWGAVLATFADLEAEASAWLNRERVPPERRRFRRTIDARYRGQNFEVRVDCAGLGPEGLAALHHRFSDAHRAAYGYDIADRPVELVTARLKATGLADHPPAREASGGPSFDAATLGCRKVYVDPATGWMEAVRLDRTRLPIETPFEGPAIVEEMSATTFLPPRHEAVRDRFGNLILTADPVT